MTLYLLITIGITLCPKNILQISILILFFQMLLMNFELELLEANLLCLSCWLHCVLKIRLSAYKSEYEHECLHFVFALFFLFLCFSFCWCQKRGKINELIREKDKKGRIVDIGYECIYWEGTYDAYWYIFVYA